MRLAIVFVLTAWVAAGCASAGQTDVPSGDTVQLTVINEFVGTVTAYALWGSGRVRLGDVGQNRTRVFFTAIRSDRVAVGLEAIGAPPAGTTPGPSRFGGGGSGGDLDPSAPYVVSSFEPVVSGDALEFRLTAGGSLGVRRMEPGL